MGGEQASGFYPVGESPHGLDPVIGHGVANLGSTVPLGFAGSFKAKISVLYEIL